MVGARMWFISVCLGSVRSGMRKERRAVERRGFSANTNERALLLMVGSLAYGTTVVIRVHQKLRTDTIF